MELKVFLPSLQGIFPWMALLYYPLPPLPLTSEIPTRPLPHTGPRTFLVALTCFPLTYHLHGFTPCFSLFRSPSSFFSPSEDVIPMPLCPAPLSRWPYSVVLCLRKIFSASTPLVLVTCPRHFFLPHRFFPPAELEWSHRLCFRWSSLLLNPSGVHTAGMLSFLCCLLCPCRSVPDKFFYSSFRHGETRFQSSCFRNVLANPASFSSDPCGRCIFRGRALSCPVSTLLFGSGM